MKKILKGLTLGSLLAIPVAAISCGGSSEQLSDRVNTTYDNAESTIKKMHEYNLSVRNEEGVLKLITPSKNPDNKDHLYLGPILINEGYWENESSVDNINSMISTKGITLEKYEELLNLYRDNFGAIKENIIELKQEEKSNMVILVLDKIMELQSSFLSRTITSDDFYNYVITLDDEVLHSIFYKDNIPTYDPAIAVTWDSKLYELRDELYSHIDVAYMSSIAFNMLTQGLHQGMQIYELLETHLNN